MRRTRKSEREREAGGVILTCFTTPLRSFTGAWGALMMPRGWPSDGKIGKCDRRRCARSSDPHVRSWVRGGSVAAALVTPRFIAPRGATRGERGGGGESVYGEKRRVSLAREAGCVLRSDGPSCWLANAGQRPGPSFPRISRGLARWLAIGASAIYHTAGDTLRTSLGLGGDVATRDNTPRDTVSHSMLRLGAGAHERAAGMREISCTGRSVRFSATFARVGGQITLASISDWFMFYALCIT